jgi:hypothetical protein
MHGHTNDIFGEAGFGSGGRVDDETWNRERLRNLLLFGRALQSGKASASSDHVVITGVLPVLGELFHNREVMDKAAHQD